MKSGMLAAEAAASALAANPDSTSPLDFSSYQAALDSSWITSELREIRNLRPSFHSQLGIYGGVAYSGLDSLMFKGRVPWTFKHGGDDYAATESASKHAPIAYPAPDGKLTFDLLTSVARTGTNHSENQPSHLVLSQSPTKREARERHVKENAPEGTFGGVLAGACPAGVYEYVDVEEAGGESDWGKRRFVINAQNCIHVRVSFNRPSRWIATVLLKLTRHLRVCVIASAKLVL